MNQSRSCHVPLPPLPTDLDIVTLTVFGEGCTFGGFSLFGFENFARLKLCV